MKKVTVEEVLTATAEHFGMSEDMIKNANEFRTKPVVHARYVANYLARVLTFKSFESIGEVLGQDHVTVSNGFSNISLALSKGEDLVSNQIDEIKKKLACK